MRREFVPFDEPTIRAEFGGLADRDRAKLAAVLEAYEEAGTGNPYPAQVDSYGEGLYRIRHVNSRYQGRAIYYVAEASEGYQLLVVLTVFKKEGGKVPHAVLDRARERKKRDQRGRKS